ncbi:acyl-CoA N-acyltransferase [Dentipellis sp. KUC8613]|nr:acyl-CoA N-acyltransferase [Dentipellis sp. KUC8613]
MFQTNRLLLRAWRDSDEEPVLATFNSREALTTGYSGWIVPCTKNNFQEIWSAHMKDCLMVVVAEEKDTGKYVGNATLHGVNPKNRDAEVVLMIDQDFQGMGYGTEIMKWLVGYAFDGLGLHRLSLSVYGNNPAGIALYKKTGFIQEGVKRKALWINGQWVDEIFMGVMDEEFRAKQTVV